MQLPVRVSLLAVITFAGRSGAHDSHNSVSSASTADSHITSSSSIWPSSIVPSAVSSSTKPTNGTCWSRTANYITHTLHQQCLRADRLVANATRILSFNEASASTGATSDHSGTSTSVANLISPSGTLGDDRAGPHHTSSTSIPRGSEPVETDLPAQVDALTETGTASSGETEESESPLDNANFLSFEEWRRQNQAKAEQAAEQPFIGDRQRPVNNALDSLGDEGEIELDFSGFGNGATAPRQQQAAYRTPEGAASVVSAAAESPTLRSKDAGKTCKERTNYASFDCAATVLKTNPEGKSASSVLVENKDSYMLNTCSATNKFFIVELCNDILIDTVVLANYEFFSSIFRHFRVSVSDRYPVKIDRWVDLGTYEARNTREVQAFLIEQPQIWARYLRIEFLSHYGGEYYCPVSLLRVHGKTMLEELRPEEDVSTVDADAAQKIEAVTEPSVPAETLVATSLSGKPPNEVGESTRLSSTSTDRSKTDVKTESVNAATNTASATPASPEYADQEVVTSGQPLQNDGSTCAFNSSTSARNESAPPLQEIVPPQSTTDAVPGKKNGKEGSPAPSETSLASSAGTATTLSNTKSSQTHPKPPANQSVSHKTDSRTLDKGPSTPTVAVDSSLKDTNRSANSNDASSPISQSSTNSTRPTATATSNGPPPQPSTQESFFKSIQKRLAQLEANSTLSLQYIEEQSRILRDAFSKVEKRQINVTRAFLSNLNDTVMAELRGFRIAYDQIWQSTVIELDGQREQYQREILAISTRLTLVAEELVWQKRLGIVQSTLVLLCLGLVLFARGGGAHYLEVPLMQQMMNKSQTALSKVASHNDWDQSPPASPSPENRSPVSLFRRKMMWRSFTEPSASGIAAGDSGTDSRPESKDGPPYPFRRHMVDVKVQPPTPERGGDVRHRSGSQSTLDREEDEDDDDDNEIFEEFGEESAPPSPEMMKSQIATLEFA